jgi:type II secretory pathway component PulC
MAMKRFIIIRFILIWIVVLFPLFYAFGNNQIRLQGILMSLDLEKNLIVVNERTFFLDDQTAFYNENGSLTSKEKFKPNSRVYIEGEKNNDRVVVRKIYFLPKRIDKKERNIYPFLQ